MGTIIFSIALAISFLAVFCLDLPRDYRNISQIQELEFLRSLSFWKIMGTFGGVILGLSLDNLILTLTFAFIGYHLPNTIMNLIRRKRQKEIDKYLEPVLQQLANIYGLSGSYEKALEYVVPSINQPLKGYFESCLYELQRTGFTLEEALERLNRKIENPNFHFFNQIILLNQKFGGDSKELMQQVPQTIRDRQIMKAELEAEIAGAKQQSWILLGLTPFFLGVFHFMQPEFARILTETSIGRLGLGIVGVLMLISYYLMEKIMRD